MHQAILSNSMAVLPTPPLEWPDTYLDYLSHYHWENQEAAKLWWLAHAPRKHKQLLSASMLGIALLQIGAYTWDDAQVCYVDWQHKPVPWATVRAALDETLTHASRTLLVLSQKLQTGQLDLPNWQTRLRDEIKAIHASSAALAIGGWAALQLGDWLRISDRVLQQLARLNAFAQQLGSGKQKRDGVFLRRTQMYAEAGRGTYSCFERYTMLQHGYTEECNVLGVAEHCNGCLIEDSRGWVAIGDLVEIGSRECLTKCQCSFTYRRT
jgi:hypothetical protein